MDKDLNGLISRFEDLGRMKQLEELLEIIQSKHQSIKGYITGDEIKSKLDSLLMKSFLKLIADKTSKEEDCSKCDEVNCPDHPSKMN